MNQTANQYFAPYKRYNDKLQPFLLNISSSEVLVINEPAIINIAGYNFDEESVAFIWKDTESRGNAIVIEGIYQHFAEIKIPFTPTEAANYNIKVVSGRAESNQLSIKAIANITESTTNTELKNNQIIRLNDLTSLVIGNNPDVKASLDILYYKSIPPLTSGEGIYISKKGYFIFPQLVSNKADKRTINFVFYCGNDMRYLVFGYCSEENFNFDSNDYNNTEYCARLRNQYGAYYQHGRFKSGRSSSTFLGYTDYDREIYYRISIPVEGDEVKLYMLNDGNIDNWFLGELQQKWQITTAPDCTGNILYPFFGNYNGSKSPLLGVFLS